MDAVPYIAVEDDQPAVDGPGPVAGASPGHRSWEEHHSLRVNAFVEARLVTKEEVCALSSVPWTDCNDSYENFTYMHDKF